MKEETMQEWADRLVGEYGGGTIKSFGLLLRDSPFTCYAGGRDSTVWEIGQPDNAVRGTAEIDGEIVAMDLW